MGRAIRLLAGFVAIGRAGFGPGRMVDKTRKLPKSLSDRMI